MKRRSFFSFLAAAVLVLLLTGIGGFYWLVAHSPIAGVTSKEPDAAMFVSKQAPVMVSMLVSPDSWETYGAVVASPGGRRRSRTQLNQLKQSLLTNTGLDYRKDVQPWLGNEITLAVTSLDIDRNGENGREPGYLMAVATQDAEKSREFLQLLFSKRALAGTDLVFDQYKGIKLIYENSRPQLERQNAVKPSPTKREETGLAAAVVGDRFVLFANDPKVLRDAINNVQAPDLNLKSSSQYQQALTLLPSRRIGVTFLNLPIVAAWLGNKPQSQTYESQIIALEFNQKGLLVETTLLAAADQEIAPSAQISQPVEALRYLPATTGLAISGSDLHNLGDTNLAQLWSQVTVGLSSSGYDAISRLVAQPLAALQSRSGIDLPQDIFSWVQGEYALGLLPHDDQSAPDWIFVAEKSDAARAGISHLDTLASEQGLSISALTLGEQKVSAWTQLTTTTTSSPDPDGETIALRAKVKGVHATVGNYEIFTTSVEAMDEALKAPQIGSLVDKPKFQTSIGAIPQPNEGYVYLDWKASQGILERQLPILKLVELAGRPFFNNLQALAISSYGSDTRALKGGVFFRLDTIEQ